jgi:topoisomerase IA-like protein
MSGSRHKALTAMRLKKEQQVYSIEQNRALQIFNYEQKLKKEHKIIEEM